MNLPAEFVSNIRGVFRERGDAFLEALPLSISQAASQWGLTNVESAPTLSYNYVAFADRGDEKVVLKMGVPNRELLSEVQALRFFNGNGACQLLEHDEKRAWMLLERLSPGEMLVTVKDDEKATHIAAEVMKQIWRPLDSDELLPVRQNFIPLSDWFDGLKRIRPMFNGGTGPFKESILQRVEEWIKFAFAENHHPALIHGDFHHFNILSSDRGWLIIDPKGVIGPAGYEVGPFLMNPWGDFLNGNNYRRMTKRRIDILHEHLGFEREHIHEWGLAHAVLSGWWCIEDNIKDEYSLPFAEMMAELDIR